MANTIRTRWIGFASFEQELWRKKQKGGLRTYLSTRGGVGGGGGWGVRGAYREVMERSFNEFTN